MEAGGAVYHVEGEPVEEPCDAPGVIPIKRAVFRAPPCGSVAPRPRHAVLSTPKAPCPPRGAFSFPDGCRAEGREPPCPPPNAPPTSPSFPSSPLQFQPL